VGQALESLIPAPNTINAGFPSFSQTVSLHNVARRTGPHRSPTLIGNYRLTFRYIHDSWSTINPNPLWGVGNSAFNNINTNFVGPGSSFVARLTANVTPTLLNEFRRELTGDHILLNAVNLPAFSLRVCDGSLFNNGFGAKTFQRSAAKQHSLWGSFGQDTGYFP